ncbi:MAG: Na+/H+ antiporter NhaA [Rikenellaceae bacterium]
MTRVISYKRKKTSFRAMNLNRSFIGSDWAGGVVLLLFTVIAMLLANIDATKHIYEHVLHSHFEIGFSDFKLSFPVEKWINDALMVLFFFYVGLEIKREVIAGHLSSFKKASLPVMAAVGGMFAPALIYAFFNFSSPEYSSGWGIPTATDIAFAIGILSLLGNRVPDSLKIFLMALAVADDLGAIIVIAVFYSSGINFILLGVAAVILFIMYEFNRNNIYNLWFYLIPGLVVWVLFMYSGIHATIAGVIIAMIIPASPRYGKKYFLYKTKYYLEEFKFYDHEELPVLANEKQYETINKINEIADHAASPSQAIEAHLAPFVTFFIMPVFALANAGVEIGSMSELQIFSHPQSLGIFFGLLLGKPLGIFFMYWIMVKLKVGTMPSDATWNSVFGVACFGGIGFTMSIFIDGLAFSDPEIIASGKIAILMGSFAAAILGYTYMRLLSKRKIKA